MFEKAIQQMQAQGFTHIKAELEAQFGREVEERECSECYGNGEVECRACDESGVKPCAEDHGEGHDCFACDGEETVECDDCGGSGQVSCEDCDGGGYSNNGDSWSDDECKQFILDRLSPETRDAITFSLFYYDGSVDSEFTITLPMAEAARMVEVIEAFNDLGHAIDNEFDVSGSGMHIAVLTDGDYPNGQKPLDEAKLDNFTREVTKLLPALYFLASPDFNSRELSYRSPSISRNKYNAISTRDNTCLEYRIFETCYQRPEAWLEDVIVIANTLKYYSNRTINIEVPERLELSDNTGQGVGRFFRNEQALRLLNAGLSLIKPSEVRVKDLKKARNFDTTMTKLRREQARRRIELMPRYERYVRETEGGNERAYQETRRYFEAMVGQDQEERMSQWPHYMINGYQLWAKARGSNREHVLKEWAIKHNNAERILSFEEWSERNNNWGSYAIQFA